MTNPYQNQDPQYGANPYQGQDPQYGANPYQGQSPQPGANPYQSQDPQQGYGNYGQPSQPPYQQQMYQQPSPVGKGFFARLFDLSFNQFVTTSVVKVIFIIMVVIQGLYALGVIISFFTLSATAGIVAFILAPICWFFAVLLTRVWLELMVVIFKIKDDLGAIRNHGGF
jgi:Domain of unknown function (DUF4282)